MKLTKYFIRGLKLSLILLLGGLILLLPKLIIVGLLILNPLVGVILYLICGIIGLTINGWLVTKYQRWIFR